MNKYVRKRLLRVRTPWFLAELPLSFITMASSYHVLLEAVSMN